MPRWRNSLSNIMNDQGNKEVQKEDKIKVIKI